MVFVAYARRANFSKRRQGSRRGRGVKRAKLLLAGGLLGRRLHGVGIKAGSRSSWPAIVDVALRAGLAGRGRSRAGRVTSWWVGLRSACQRMSGLARIDRGGAELADAGDLEVQDVGQHAKLVPGVTGGRLQARPGEDQLALVPRRTTSGRPLPCWCEVRRCSGSGRRGKRVEMIWCGKFRAARGQEGDGFADGAGDGVSGRNRQYPAGRSPRRRGRSRRPGAPESRLAAGGSPGAGGGEDERGEGRRKERSAGFCFGMDTAGGERSRVSRPRGSGVSLRSRGHHSGRGSDRGCEANSGRREVRAGDGGGVPGALVGMGCGGGGGWGHGSQGRRGFRRGSPVADEGEDVGGDYWRVRR
mgnify:CR=1 FL=1